MRESNFISNYSFVISRSFENTVNYVSLKLSIVVKVIQLLKTPQIHGNHQKNMCITDVLRYSYDDEAENFFHVAV